MTDKKIVDAIIAEGKYEVYFHIAYERLVEKLRKRSIPVDYVHSEMAKIYRSDLRQRR